MIKKLYIKNLAIIDEVCLEFENGLNIITGQTGSGKSIIINAIDLLLGSNFSKNLIRTGESSCVVEGYFLLNKFEYNIRRVFYKNSASKAFLNEMPITLNEIKKISEKLVDFHGQHNHQKLLDIANHIECLDAYGNYAEDLKHISDLYLKINSLNKKLDETIIKQKNIFEKNELNNFQLEELSKYNLKDGIDIDVESNYNTLINIKEIKEDLDNFINDFDIHDNSILSIINKNLKQIDKYENINKHLDSFINRLDQINIEIKDLCDEIHTYSDNLNFDEIQFEEVSDKLSFLEMIKRKYGGSIQSALAYKAKIEHSIEDGKNYKQEIENLTKNIVFLKKTYSQLAKEISLKRCKTAKKINKTILPILKNIGMDKTSINFEVNHDPDGFNINGADMCIIKISTNVGEKMKPLNEIVSGGELSRIMLAIKMLLQEKDPVDTIIFDEVDSGISGQIAEQVGDQIEKLGKKRQIVCITHLSQIACKGKYHLSIGKKSFNNKTNVYIEKLTENKRIEEIASLISGKQITENATNQARELLSI